MGSFDRCPELGGRTRSQGEGGCRGDTGPLDGRLGVTYNLEYMYNIICFVCILYIYYIYIILYIYTLAIYIYIIYTYVHMCDDLVI